MSPLEPGSVCPDFALRDQHGRTVVLSEFAGRPVVLVFYPWAFSRVCSGELSALQQLLPRFQELEASLLAISCDPMFSLRAYAETDGLEFPLLSDHWPHGGIARNYGVFDEENGAARRSTYVVAADGKISWAVHNPLGTARDPEEYLSVLAELRSGNEFGSVCRGG